MTKQVPKILKSPLGDRYYIATKYTQSGQGFKTTEKFDITDQIGELLIAHGRIKHTDGRIAELRTHTIKGRIPDEVAAARLSFLTALRNQTGDKL